MSIHASKCWIISATEKHKNRDKHISMQSSSVEWE